MYNESDVDVSATSPDSRYTASVFWMDEGTVLPYGNAVRVKPRLSPFWHASDLVFAGYCAPGMRLSWASDTTLVVHCQVREGQALRLEPPEGITVVHDGAESLVPTPDASLGPSTP